MIVIHTYKRAPIEVLYLCYAKRTDGNRCECQQEKAILEQICCKHKTLYKKSNGQESLDFNSTGTISSVHSQTHENLVLWG